LFDQRDAIRLRSAIRHGLARSWSCQLERAGAPRPRAGRGGRIAGDRFGLIVRTTRRDGAELVPAKARGAASGLYLPPYRNQAVLVDTIFTASLGFKENDRDLRALGQDWSMPRDADWWHRVAIRLALTGCANDSRQPRRHLRALPA
jgi:hypothetical protein